MRSLVYQSIFAMYFFSTCLYLFFFLFFFFQAEDGIRDADVTGVQRVLFRSKEYRQQHGAGDKLMMSFHGVPERFDKQGDPYSSQCRATAKALAAKLGLSDDQYICSRSEERRVGKECRSRW